MTKMSNDSKERGLLPFDVIVAANTGDPQAILTVMKHYDSWMMLQARRRFVKPNGESSYAVDQEIYDELMIKLIEVILSFEV
ncbi:MAG: helix-turn-helix domain-containing protein [Solobacterium sp.]|nr:helix-turn-helix domain-containing protein [Solobacterium sp.]